MQQVFGNSNSLPISLVLSLSQTIKGLHWDKVPRDNDDEVAARGILYLLIFQQLGQLVRWTWGYNILLAPREKFDGTAENINSRLEHGEASTPETTPLLQSSSSYSEGEDQDASGSDDTVVDGAGGGKRSPSEGQIDQSSGAAQYVPSTFKRRDSRSSSRSFGKSLSKNPIRSDPLSMPLNGNIKSVRNESRPNSLLDPTSTRAPTTVETPKGVKGFPARFRKAIARALQVITRTIKGQLMILFNKLPNSSRILIKKAFGAIQRFLLGVWAFMNPPLWAMLAAIMVASIPDLQRFFFTNGTFFENSVTSAIRQSGGVAVPLILVVLGANLARNTLPSDPNHTKEDDKEETKLLIAALISRMLLPTIVMAPLLAVTAKYVPVSILDDPIFVIVCFLITGAPSALQLAQICQINNVYMGTMSRLLFQSYVVWILPSTLVLVMCALEVVEWAQR